MITLKSYITSFISSLVLTLAAFTLVYLHDASGHLTFTHEFLIPAVLVLAFVQLIIQLVFFLHLFQEQGPRWNLAIFASTIGIVFILVAGSLWISAHLNANMTQQEMNSHIIDQSTF